MATAVEETTRFNYFKITIAQGIVIDPRIPDEATVFALVVSPNELDTLRNRLRAALQNQVQESPVDPTVVTQLADIGQVQACPPSPAADMIPRDGAGDQGSRCGRQRGGCSAGRAAGPRSTADSRAGAELTCGGSGQAESGPNSGADLDRPGLGLARSPGLTGAEARGD